MKRSAILLLVFCAPCFGKGGATGVGGGGAQIESAFRLRGVQLIGEIAESPAANAECTASDMQNGLESSKVLVVDQLIDPATQTPITGQDLDAWTIPGKIQLLQKSWADFFNPQTPHDGRSVDALILHEIYRSTGICDDENFKISDDVFEKITLSNKYTKAYSFDYTYDAVGLFESNSGEDPATPGTCDKSSPSQPGQTVTGICAVVNKAGNKLVIVQAIFSASDTPTQTGGYLAEFDLGGGENMSVRNLLAAASSSMPFLILENLQTGTGLYGLDPSHLNSF